MAPRVLVSDTLSDAAVKVFHDRGIEVDFQPQLGRDPDRLAEVIGAYDGLAVRSATKVTEALLQRATRLRVIGRAGIGVDNVDLAAASRAGIVVMNTPFGNSITTAEHSIAMMLAMARRIPQADASMHAGKWEKGRFLGVELTGKTLGVVGAGNVGGNVIDRARGLHMKVITHDPFMSEDRAAELGTRKVELDELLAEADIITLHVPLTDKTRNILSAEAIATTKPGVRIINCARGGLVDEAALLAALESGHVAGAALDVFATEPPRDNPLLARDDVIATPHLGASTVEAQEKVAIQAAEQMSDYLLTGAVSHSVNMPSVSAEEARSMGPWLKLAEHLGAFVGQMTDEAIHEIHILYDGTVTAMNMQALTAATIAGLMRTASPDANMVSAPIMARERGIRIATTTRDKSGTFDGYIKISIVSGQHERAIAGTVFSDNRPRFIQIRGINLDAEIGRHMLYTRHRDMPGVIGTLGVILGEMGVNMANFALGRDAPGGDAIAIIYLDAPLRDEVRKALLATGKFAQVRPLEFDT